jgi:hypothetical protein
VLLFTRKKAAKNKKKAIRKGIEKKPLREANLWNSSGPSPLLYRFLCGILIGKLNWREQIFTSQLYCVSTVRENATENKMAPETSAQAKLFRMMQQRIFNTHFGCQVFEDGRRVHGSCGTDTSMAGCPVFQMTVDTTDWELQEERGGA